MLDPTPITGAQCYLRTVAGEGLRSVLSVRQLAALRSGKTSGKTAEASLDVGEEEGGAGGGGRGHRGGGGPGECSGQSKVAVCPKSIPPPTAPYLQKDERRGSSESHRRATIFPHPLKFPKMGTMYQLLIGFGRLILK